MKKILLINIVLIALLFSACKKDFDPGTTEASAVANEWWTTLSSGGVDLIGQPIKILTYNSADSKDSIWVDDKGNGYGFKAKAYFSGLTFSSGAGAPNVYYKDTITFPRATYGNYAFTLPPTLKISNGKVLLHAGKSRTGNVVDSIYFEAEFVDDPGTKYIYSGTARTNWPEDDY